MAGVGHCRRSRVSEGYGFFCWVACCRKQVFAKASGVVGSLAVDVTATTLTGTFVISSSGVPTVSDTFVIVKQPGYVRPSTTYC